MTITQLVFILYIGAGLLLVTWLYWPGFAEAFMEGIDRADRAGVVPDSVRALLAACFVVLVIMIWPIVLVMILYKLWQLSGECGCGDSECLFCEYDKKNNNKE